MTTTTPDAAEQPTETTPQVDATTASDTAGDQGNETAEVDYKAKYEAMKKHSRDWEAKAKANLEAANKLKELEDAEKTELEKLTEERDALKVEVDAANSALERVRIAAKHGLSVEDAELFLHGDAEAMAKQAEALAGRQKAKTRSAEDPFQGRGSSPDARQAAKSWAESLFKK